MENFIEVAHSILLKDLPHDGVFVDYTMTDGYNALYMAKYVSEGNIVAFANDREQIDNAYALFESNFQDNAHIVSDNPLNAPKYLTGDINGFMLDAVAVDMCDDDIIALINTSLNVMRKGRKGMMIIGKINTRAMHYIENMPKDKVSIMEMSMANSESPNVYIIEKLV